jgi:hypothetical protein
MRPRTLPLVAAALAFACVADEAPRGQPAAPAAIGAAPQHAPPIVATLAPAAEISETDFTTLRDPFVPTVVPTPPPPERGDVAFAESPVRTLRVTGTIAGGAGGKAIVADDSGETRVLAVGERVGKPEAAADGSLAEWRVDRVREGNVVLVREGGNERPKVVLGEVAGASKRRRSSAKVGGGSSRR